VKSISFGSNLMVNETRIELNGRTRIAFSEKGLILTYISAKTRLGVGVDPDSESGGELEGGREEVNFLIKVGRCCGDVRYAPSAWSCCLRECGI
jgi:hypothetical protein